MGAWKGCKNYALRERRQVQFLVILKINKLVNCVLLITKRTETVWIACYVVNYFYRIWYLSLFYYKSLSYYPSGNNIGIVFVSAGHICIHFCSSW